MTAKTASRSWTLWHGLTLVLALAALVAGLALLHAPRVGLTVAETRVADVPLTIYHPFGNQPAPVAVIAHGFAGSRHLMRPLAETLARNGYLAVTFDFPGHGDHPGPLAGALGTAERAAALLATLATVVDYARTVPGSDGRVAVLGHSMAGDIMARYAHRSPDALQAAVAFSPYFAQPARAAALPNLLIVYGALEPEMVREQGAVALTASLGAPPELGRLYGDPHQGTARRLLAADQVEHIGVLFSATALDAARDWLNLVFDRHCQDHLPPRGAALALLYGGLLLLGLPLARLLPQVSTTPLGAGLGWSRLWSLALLPAILTPLLLRWLPTDFTPLAIGDYVALHFAVYGLLTLLGLSLVGAWPPRRAGSGFALLVALLLWAAYAVLAIGWLTERFVANFLPDVARLPWVGLLLCGTVLYFIADEWLTRGPGHGRGAYLATKVLFLLSLVLAVVLNRGELFFLVIIVPAILVLFVLYGILGTWAYARTGHPLVSAFANALAFASAIAVTFPILAT